MPRIVEVGTTVSVANVRFLKQKTPLLLSLARFAMKPACAGIVIARNSRRAETRPNTPRRMGMTKVSRRKFIKAAGAGGAWRRGRDCRGAGHRAVVARGEMAPDGELAEVARYAVWKSRVSRQARRRAHRQQVPDPGVCGRRNRAWSAGARCRAGGQRRGGSHGALLLLRQGPDLHVRHRPAVRHEQPHEECLVHARWRPAADG